jgi:hypothetical protein
MPLNKLPTKMSAGFGLSMIDRAVKEVHATRCSAVELRTVHEYFRHNGGLQCIYCRQADATRWDHLHPVSRGGDTVPGNLVPACGSCDDSKQDREVDEWIQGGSAKRPASHHAARINEEIALYRSKFKYEPKPFVEKLSEKQKATYTAFQGELQLLRQHLQEAGLLKVKK